MQTIKQTLLSSWNFMRWLRLAVGVLIGIQAIRTSDVFSGIIAIFFLFQAITNTGCCGSGGCTIPNKK
jgi:uncharacterized membrane protein HdeD (DUF308 family)